MPDYNTNVLFDHILASVAAPGTIAQRMRLVIDECERQVPHRDWRRMRRIDFDADAPLLSEWLTEAWLQGALHAGHQGLWFGIFNPIVDDESTSEMYVASAPTYDPTEAWFCGIHPGDGEGFSYLGSAVLDDIYRIAYGPKNGLKNNAEYPLALSYAAMAACSALSQQRLALEWAALRGAAAGFDAGYSLVLGTFDNLRFIQQISAE